MICKNIQNIQSYSIHFPLSSIFPRFCFLNYFHKNMNLHKYSQFTDNTVIVAENIFAV